MQGRWEHGSPQDLHGDRIAVLAQWSEAARVSRSLAALVRELAASGYRTLVVSTCEAAGSLPWPDDARPTAVIRRPNVGYDFGSWAVALDMAPDIASRDRVLLCNDSLVGPFGSLAPALAHFSATRADAWSLSTSDQFGRHLQSFFVGFTGGALSTPPLRRFYSRIRPRTSKQDVIAAYELGLSQLLVREGFALTAYLPSKLAVDGVENPMIIGWRRALDFGVPLVKRELLLDPSVAPDAADIAAVVRERYGVDIEDWL
jgi:lipopolysaccharide biosynthesis protein